MKLLLASCRGLPPREVDDLALVRALEARGAEVSVLPWDQPGLDPGAFAACLVRTTWDYTRRLPEFLAWVEATGAATRLYNPPATIRWNADKSYLFTLAARGVPLAPTLAVEAPEALPGLLAGRGWRTAFLKPRVAASSEGTLRFDTDADGLARAVAHLAAHAAAQPGRGFLLQPYLARVEAEGERSAILVEGRLAHCVVKRPLPGDWRVQDDHGASDAPYDPGPAELALVEQVMAALPPEAGLGAGPPLQARVDWLLDDEGAPVLVELELIEPSLFLRHGPRTADRLADALIARATV